MDFNESLIELVRNYEILYNLKDENYRRTDIKEKIWLEISIKLGAKIDECRKKWKSLRDTYKKLKKNELLPSGSSPKLNRKKWKYLDMLAFLENYESSRQTLGNIAPEENISNKEDEEVELFGPSSRIPDSVFEFDFINDENTNLSSSITNKKTNNKRKMGSEDIPMKLSKIMASAAKTLDEIKNEKANSTSKVFEALASKITDVNMPPSKVLKLEVAVSKLVGI